MLGRLGADRVNTRDGQAVSVRRGDILLFVTYRQGESAGEVSFTGGYPFADGSTVSVQIGDDRFELFTDGQWAWAGLARGGCAHPGGDAPRRQCGADRAFGRGTKTRDTFSLLGLTAATDEAERRCAT
jgi:hypothetical protein